MEMHIMLFDTPEELDVMRERIKADGISNPQYDSLTRGQMKNSLTLSKEEVTELLDKKNTLMLLEQKYLLRQKSGLRTLLEIG